MLISEIPSVSEGSLSSSAVKGEHDSAYDSTAAVTLIDDRDPSPAKCVVRDLRKKALGVLRKQVSSAASLIYPVSASLWTLSN